MRDMRVDLPRQIRVLVPSLEISSDPHLSLLIALRVQSHINLNQSVQPKTYRSRSRFTSPLASLSQSPQPSASTGWSQLSVVFSPLQPRRTIYTFGCFTMSPQYR